MAGALQPHEFPANGPQSGPSHTTGASFLQCSFQTSSILEPTDKLLRSFFWSVEEELVTREAKGKKIEVC